MWRGVSGVFVFAAPWRLKLVGLALGLAFIANANVIRLCTMYATGVFFPKAFDFVHRELWPALLVVLVLAAFLHWAGWSGLRRPEAAHAPTG